MRTLGWSLVVLLLVACAPDRSITRGADGAPEWDQRLRAAVPVSEGIDVARATLVKSGFRCAAADSLGSFWCEKWSGGRWDIVRRRWYASIESRADRVTAVRSSTSLTGP